MVEQQKVHSSALQCLAVWMGKRDSSAETCLHAEALVLRVESNGTHASQAGREFRFLTDDSSLNFHVTKIQIAPVGNQSLASALVTSSKYCGWIVLLNMGDQWQCISATFSPPSVCTTPQDYQDVIQLTWDGYSRANRMCDGKKMATVFHPMCRLTEATDVCNDTSTTRSLFLKNQTEFCELVTKRYDDPNSRHYPFRQLKDDLSFLSQYDSLLSIDFATDRVALVTLRIGHPPCLWTDYLTVAKISSQWWIVHKSSCSEPFPEMK
ncbi:hypothetical protein FisN_16Hu294 [Fistulifera solaris]|jgi:hypothetical protein|uniref:Uncharacterized protein n=1 Tax=Fistulifera solaris TaxID=1519565 RepID=A0A1Z5KSJ1_FISSO|nr:hypothetical protein FisN_16Hu294 [Fistulifera solaris]|eukprot:GAX29276.1 hypothetical protein FisN_16Hu294 [Fistulifera solaris]